MSIIPRTVSIASSNNSIKRRRTLRRTLAAASAVVVGTVTGITREANAAVTFTNRAAFIAAINPVYYNETFDALGDGDLLAPTRTFAANGYSFIASTGAALPDDNDLFGADGPTSGDYELSTTIPSNLTFTFPTGNVTAVGGDFTLLDDAFHVASDTFQMNLSDGTTVTRTSGGGNTPFFAFTSTVPITSLTFVVPTDATNNEYFATVNNFTVGSVPEPASLALIAIGGVGLLRRRRIRASS